MKRKHKELQESLINFYRQSYDSSFSVETAKKLAHEAVVNLLTELGIEDGAKAYSFLMER